jgi:Ni/Fe-hydrogenase subunit HybB-like protein
MNRVHVVKATLWGIVGLGLAVAISRFAFGLGATTNLTDATPWGLWIGFDVMGGVALAAGGFVITAIFYMMRKDEFRLMVKPAVLTAFLGYIAVIVSLLADLGLPWNIWHMMIYWNPHSPLFEVGWCVMLYTTVLLLEFSPTPLEEFSRYAKIRNFLMKFRFPLVLAGIMLSTLHQSSLGSLFLIMPFKLNPLWYTPILPILFFITAVSLGLMMVSFESLVTGWIYGRKPETELISKLAKAAVWVLALYLAVRFADLGIGGKFPLIFNGQWESYLFLAEILLMAIIPIIIFSIRKSRQSTTGLWIGSFLVVFGTVFYRINVGGLTMLTVTGDNYFPSWMEFAVSAGVVSFMILVFLYSVENFKIWERKPRERESDPFEPPAFSRAGEVWLGSPPVAGRTKYSFVFIVALALGFGLTPGDRLCSGGAEEVSTHPARGGDSLFIDGNRDGYGVNFPHKSHIDAMGQQNSCAVCHHLNLPRDKNSRCFACHNRQYVSGDAFRHDWHADPKGGNIACVVCHEKGQNRDAASAKKCDACHADLLPPGATIAVDSYVTPAYVDAMHILCVECHKKKATEIADKSDLGYCAACHIESAPDHLQPEIKNRLPRREYNRVVLPGFSSTKP